MVLLQNQYENPNGGPLFLGVQMQLPSVLCFTLLHNPFKKGGVWWNWEFQIGLFEWILDISPQKVNFVHGFHASVLPLRLASLPKNHPGVNKLALNGPSQTTMENPGRWEWLFCSADYVSDSGMFLNAASSYAFEMQLLMSAAVCVGF